jgi:hypothetical protein
MAYCWKGNENENCKELQGYRSVIHWVSNIRELIGGELEDAPLSKMYWLDQ